MFFMLKWKQAEYGVVFALHAHAPSFLSIIKIIIIIIYVIVCALILFMLGMYDMLIVDMCAHAFFCRIYSPIYVMCVHRSNVADSSWFFWSFHVYPNIPYSSKLFAFSLKI